MREALIIILIKNSPRKKKSSRVVQDDLSHITWIWKTLESVPTFLRILGIFTLHKWLFFSKPITIELFKKFFKFILTVPFLDRKMVHTHKYINTQTDALKQWPVSTWDFKNWNSRVTDSGKTHRAFWGRESQGLIRAKGHKVVRACLARIIINSDRRKEIFFHEG